MQTIILNIADHAVDKIMAIINTLPKQEVQVVNQQKSNDMLDEKNISNLSLAELGGVLSSYADQKITDEEIEEAINKGITKRAMMNNA